MAAEPTFATFRIVWAVLLVSQVVYAGVGLTMHGSTGGAMSDNRVFPLVLGAVAALQIVAAQLFWRRASGAGRALHEGPGLAPEAAFRPYILAWVLDESVAIYGLVLALLGLPHAIWTPFAAVAFGMMLWHRPAAAAS